ncbi:MAG: ABC transporter ATP-binding protein [Gordonia sp. (in: high G+C Gram-positive bacteria)]
MTESVLASAARIRKGAPVLTVDGLNISSRNGTLVRDVSFTLHAGERVGLIGESGSGKSLTSLAIMGLLPDNLTATGSIRLTQPATELVGASQKTYGALRGLHLGMVFQEPMSALNPTMRIGTQIAEVLLLHRTVPDTRAARGRALELLRQVRMPDPQRSYDAYPHELSGGQRQRVVLAIAMANRPSLLICDEPTTALDVTVQAHMLSLIGAGVAADDSALLFITHDLAVVATICERIVVMYGGEMIETGLVRDVLSAPKHPYTRGLLAASDLTAVDANGRLRTLSPDVFGYKAKVGGCAYCQGADRGGSESREFSRWVVTESGGYACWHDDAESAAAAAVGGVR